MSENKSIMSVDNSAESEIEKELMCQFTSALQKLRYELEKNLSEIDVLNSNKLKNIVSLFNGRLAIFQSDFLQYLKDYSENPNSTFDPPLRSEKEIQKLLAIIVGSSLASALVLSTLVVSTSGFLFWSTSVTLGSAIGAKLGVPAGPATAGASVVVGAVAGGAAVVFSRPLRRRIIKDKILKTFDKETVVELKRWALERIRSKIHG